MTRYLISGEMHIPRFHKIGALWVQNNSERKNYDSIVVNSTPIKSFTSEFIQDIQQLSPLIIPQSPQANSSQEDEDITEYRIKDLNQLEPICIADRKINKEL